MALTHGTQQALWMYNFLGEADFLHSLSVALWADNWFLIALAEIRKGHIQAKQIDIWYHYICEQVCDSNIEIISISSLKNVANIFTKPLLWVVYKRLTSLISLKSKCGMACQRECWDETCLYQVSASLFFFFSLLLSYIVFLCAVPLQSANLYVYISLLSNLIFNCKNLL